MSSFSKERLKNNPKIKDPALYSKEEKYNTWTLLYCFFFPKRVRDQTTLKIKESFQQTIKKSKNILEDDTRRSQVAQVDISCPHQSNRYTEKVSLTECHPGCNGKSWWLAQSISRQSVKEDDGGEFLIILSFPWRGFKTNWRRWRAERCVCEARLSTILETQTKVCEAPALERKPNAGRLKETSRFLVICLWRGQENKRHKQQLWK